MAYELERMQVIVVKYLNTFGRKKAQVRLLLWVFVVRNFQFFKDIFFDFRKRVLQQIHRKRKKMFSQVSVPADPNHGILGSL
jgi:hypothetical protein